MRRIVRIIVLSIASIAASSQVAHGQMGGGYGGGPGGGYGTGGRPQTGAIDPGGDTGSGEPRADKPDAASRKAYAAGLKSLGKARDNDAAAALATSPDKKAKAEEKANDFYNRALDQFTEALRNKGDMVEAWNNVGYVHLKLGAFGEAVDDYNHTLALKPDLIEAIEHRAEAWLAIDHLDEAKIAYMDLFNHARPLADQLLTVMQRWVVDHRANANGMRAADIESFDKWLQERDGIAKQTASLPR